MRRAGWGIIIPGVAALVGAFVYAFAGPNGISTVLGVLYTTMVAAGLLTIGGALLLRVRVALWRHKRAGGAPVSVELTPVGARLSMAF